MYRDRLFVSLSLFVAFSTAQAAEIYKSVGPDGKVTYSDRPPADTNSGYDKIQKPSLPTVATPGSNSAPTLHAETAAAQPTARTSKKALRAQKPPEAPPVVAKVDPELQSAVIGVLGIEDLVRKTEDLCLGVLPTSFKRYFGATDDWRRRNASFIAKAHYVLDTQFDAAGRHLVESGVDQRNAGVFSKITSAPAAAKINWCDRSTDEIKAWTMDFRNKDKLASPLMRMPGG